MLTQPGSGANQELLDRLLNAAEASFDRHGFDRLSMEEISKLAGVSRGFVYKHLRNRDGLVLAVLVRRAQRFNDRARVFISSQRTVADSIVEGIMLAVKLAHRDPYFGKLVGAATTDPANRVQGAPEAAAALSDELWRPVLAAAQDRGELRSDIDLDDAVQWIMYLELILLASKTTFEVDDETIERQLRTMFLPALATGDIPTAAVPAPNGADATSTGGLS